MPRCRNNIKMFSVFGQIESAAAKVMLERHPETCRLIEPADIPATVSVNDAGQRVLFAILMPRGLVREFNSLIAELRA